MSRTVENIEHKYVGREVPRYQRAAAQYHIGIVLWDDKRLTGKEGLG